MFFSLSQILASYLPEYIIKLTGFMNPVCLKVWPDSKNVERGLKPCSKLTLRVSMRVNHNWNSMWWQSSQKGSILHWNILKHMSLLSIGFNSKGKLIGNSMTPFSFNWICTWLIPSHEVHDTCTCLHRCAYSTPSEPWYCSMICTRTHRSRYRLHGSWLEFDRFIQWFGFLGFSSCRIRKQKKRRQFIRVNGQLIELRPVHQPITHHHTMK